MMRNLFERLFESYNRLPEGADPFRKAIVVINMLIPVICLAGLFAGAVLAWRKNRWGYYIFAVSALGLAAEVLIFS